MSHDSYTPTAGCDSTGPTATESPQYACPHCDAVYERELLTRVHITRADDSAHRPYNGMQAGCEVPVVDSDGTVFERRSRQPDNIDLSTIERSDFPSSLTDKRRTALLVASKYPTVTNRQELTDLVEEWAEDTDWEAPSSWTVGRAIDAFYGSGESDDDTTSTDAADPSLTDLEPLQQAIIICRLAKPEISQTAIGRKLDCAESYPGQVLTKYQGVIRSLSTACEDANLAETLSDALSPEAWKTLTATTQITAAVDADVLPERLATASGEDSSEPSTTSAATQITGQWGSPIDDSQPMSATPALSSEATGDDTTDSEPINTAAETTPGSTDVVSGSEHEGNADLSESTRSTPGTEPESGINSDTPATEEITRQIKELKTQVAVVEDLLTPIDESSPESRMLVNLAGIVESRCDELIELTE